MFNIMMFDVMIHHYLIGCGGCLICGYLAPLRYYIHENPTLFTLLVTMHALNECSLALQNSKNILVGDDSIICKILVFSFKLKFFK